MADEGERFIEIGGLRVKVGTADECEAATVVVCALAEVAGDFFADNVRGVCSGCGRAIVWRPYAPARPPRVCFECAVAMARAEKGADDAAR